LQEWQKKRKDKEFDEQQAEEDARRVKEDDVVTWTGKKLGSYDKKVGHLAKRNATTDTEGLIVDTLEAQEPVKKKPKASGFGNFSGW